MSLKGPNTSSSNNNYTNFHLSALTFLHPPNDPDHHYQCQCHSQAQQQNPDQIKHIRVYHNEPSAYPYNQDCYVIKESRYSSLHGWHASSDDLVADDAISGSAVVGVGWWVEGGEDGKDVWETRVYYVDKNGMLRERTNRSLFSPDVSDEFDAPLPEPDALVQPTPGWKSTPLSNVASTSTTASFPAVQPLPSTKLAACRSHDGILHVFYQAGDESILELVFQPGKGWVDGGIKKVVEAGKAKAGSPLAVVVGGWNEFRLFYADKEDMLKEAYGDDHRAWMESTLPPYPLHPTAMLTAVAWAFGSPYLQIRLYITSDTDDLHELVFSRHTGGWAPTTYQSVSGNAAEPLPQTTTSLPLSAVAAIRGECDRQTKVYYHPRRKIIAEWDVEAKTPAHAGITKICPGAIKRREIEEETRKKIAEEEERKQKAAPPIATPEVQKIIDKIGKCESGYPWKEVDGGYRCEGGGHFVSDAQVRAASGRV